MQVDHYLQDALGKLARALLLLDWNIVDSTLVVEGSNWSHDGRCARAEGLVEALLLNCLDHVLDLEGAHRYLKLSEALH